MVRAFVQLRQASAVHADLAKRLTELEWTTEPLELSHDSFSRNTRNQLRQVFEALRELANKVTPAKPPKRSIGFITPQEDKKAPKAGSGTSEAAPLASEDLARQDAEPLQALESSVLDDRWMSKPRALNPQK